MITDANSKIDSTVKGGSYGSKDTFFYSPVKETRRYTLGDIFESSINRWAHLPIISDSNTRTGSYRAFKDFKQNEIIADSLTVVFDENDSLYHLKPVDSKKIEDNIGPYAICVSGQFYLRIKQNGFVNLVRKGNSFEFYMPTSLPNIYTYLSLEEIRRRNFGGTANSGNVAADLASIFVNGAVDKVSKESKEK